MGIQISVAQVELKLEPVKQQASQQQDFHRLLVFASALPVPAMMPSSANQITIVLSLKAFHGLYFAKARSDIRTATSGIFCHGATKHFFAKASLVKT